MNQFVKAPLWSLAFRPFFLLASLASVLSLCIWLVYLNYGLLLNQQQILPAVVWHIHEMFFGFTLMVAVGFLLTAVQTWTGLKSLQGYSLLVLSLIWISIRLLLLADRAYLPGLLVLQLIWWVIVFFSFSRLIIKARSQRNYIFLPLLFSLMLLQLNFIYWGSQGEVELVIHLARSSILIFSIIVSLIAGRIIPLFTRNGFLSVQIKGKIKSTPRLDWALLIFSILGASNFLISYFYIMPISPAWALLIVGVLHLIRLSQWAGIYTLNNPLLWSLHASYLCLASGLLLIAISFYSDLVRIADAFHLITLGVFGGMILAMISRVSLGHTGRPMQVNSWMALAFSMIFIAAILRTVLAMIGQPLWAWNSSAILWVAAFSIFLRFYIPILITPSLDSSSFKNVSLKVTRP